ncbi:glycosyltransferase [Haloechinothrix sp. LS1_15]|uniref:glycosyltransferase n=1 Tax=Haloechinothrix sp. LS1_15 TaxID=2652248 RepID=UPI00294B634D|nr:glycosyltransferase [Haloechinothrix sp. LS1_15]
MAADQPVDRVVLATSNGTGMGHLTRQLCVALSLEPSVEPVFFSLSGAAGVINHYGFRGEYCPSRERGWIPETRWHDYLAERLRAFVAETGARAVVFDGVVPYLGLLRARLAMPDVAFVWMRRGYWRAGARTTPLRSAALFDLVLEPGDLAGEGDTGATAHAGDAVRLPPVSLLEHLRPLPREEAAAAMGIDPDRPTALVTLAAGTVNDVIAPGAAALHALLADPEWQVVVTRSALNQQGIELAEASRCVELKGIYPLAKYLNAVDAAVSAGGYNSVHELLYARVPTLLVPNRFAATDDQAARVTWLAGAGMALHAEEADLDSVRTQAGRLREATVRAELSDACAALDRPTGGTAAATRLMGLLDDPRERRPRPRTHSVEVRARLAAMRALGPRGTAMVRRALGRAPSPGPTGRMPVRLVEARQEGNSPTGAAATPLVLAEELDNELLQSGYPVEQLIDGASSGYRHRRLRIARRYYRVQEGV